MTLTLDKPIAPADAPAANAFAGRVTSGRLASLDVFRGLVILAMLIVNNIGDADAVGFFWKHADWSSRPFLESMTGWWRQFRLDGAGAIFDFPLLRNCTLADYVMPMFMLIIGIAIPFSAAAAKRRNNVGARYWLGVVRRGLTIYVLGWCIDLSLQFMTWHHRNGADARLMLTLSMNVLQLLGISYIVARILYAVPPRLRLALAAALFIAHWSLLRFLPQGAIAPGTFTEAHNSPGYLYATLPIFRTIPLLPWLQFNIVGILSVPPAAATMVLGTWMGDTLRDETIANEARLRRLIVGGGALVLIGIAWSVDLPMNKPRWTPCYLVYCAGVGSLSIALLYGLIDVRQLRRYIWPLVALGTNAIGIYFLSIMAKIWLLNLPRHSGGGELFTQQLVRTLQRTTSPTTGSWLFTLMYVGVVWCAAAIAYRRRWIWKV